MGQSIIESMYFATCPNKSCEAKAVLACIRGARCFEVVVHSVVLVLLNVAFLTIILSPGTLQAATITAASCSRADVGTAITAAQNGDTVTIPAGTCTWTTGLGTECIFAGFDRSLCNPDGTPKYITIQGAGIGQTVLIDQIPKTGVIQSIMRWKVNGNGLSRITGIEFRGSAWSSDCAHTGAGVGGALISLETASNQVRLDHNKFVTHGGCPATTIGGYIRGVADHNFFDISGVAGDPVNPGYCNYLFHETWGNVGGDGDNSWAQPDTVGTAEAFFFENNTFHNAQTLLWYQPCLDGWAGSRIVVRYNNFRASYFDNHGADTANRSQRQYEVYNNTWTGPDGVSAWNLQGNASISPIPSRGGVGVVFNNSILMTNGGVPTAAHQASYFGVPNAANRPRAEFGFCNGSNPWDQNSDSRGQLCVDQTGAGYGDLIDSAGGHSPCAGPFPTNVTRGCVQAWPRQVAQPSYTWGNTINGVPAGGQVVAGGFTTPISMGKDLIDGVLPGYTPYTYPHPLVTSSGTTAPPVAPQNLTIR